MIKRVFSIPRVLLGLGLCLAGLAVPVLGQVPNAPGTGRFTVQMFMGGTQNTYLCINPPTMYTNGTPIPVGTPVSIKIYRSMSGAPGTFTTAVSLAYGGTGTVGQGAAGTQQRPWIDITALTPVDCIEPRIVFLAASAVIGSTEGPQTTNNLSFRYAAGGAPGSSANCYPDLIRYPNPAAALGTVAGGAQPSTAPPGTVAPNPPGTGPFSVQMFLGGTQYTYLCLNPPTTYVDGTGIPQGTNVTIKIYRSMDQGASYATSVSIASGGQGTVGMGAAGTQQKPWIDLTVITPVDCIEPRIVFLAATAVVNGVESAQTSNNLTFRYAIEGAPGKTDNCFPILIRYATPLGAGVGQGTRIPTAPPRNTGGGGGGGGNINASIALVIDMSGSMNDPAPGGGGRKVDIAKAAAVEALKNLPQGTEVCLYSFGRASCDVNLENGFTTDLAALAGKVQSLNGNGSTPLAAAITTARDYIVNQGSGLTGQIILLSDGMETCHGDPEKAAENVRNKTFSPPAAPSALLEQPAFSLFPRLYAQELPPGQASPMQLTPQQLQQEQQRAQGYASQDPSLLPPDESQPAQSGTTAPTVTGQAQNRSQMNISVSTIGLGLAPNSPEQQALDKIAKAGGGQSYSAQNLSQLTRAFNQAINPGGGGGGGGGIIPGGQGLSWELLALIGLAVGIIIILVIVLVVRRPKGGAAPGLRVRASLEVVYGDGRRQNFTIQQATTGIGRDTNNALVIDDSSVSARHAEITASPSGFFIRDLGSSNGTMVNGRKVTESPLYAGDVIQLGSAKLTLKG
jgi:hypothetical protein